MARHAITTIWQGSQVCSERSQKLMLCFFVCLFFFSQSKTRTRISVHGKPHHTSCWYLIICDRPFCLICKLIALALLPTEGSPCLAKINFKIVRVSCTSSWSIDHDPLYSGIWELIIKWTYTISCNITLATLLRETHCMHKAFLVVYISAFSMP